MVEPRVRKIPDEDGDVAGRRKSSWHQRASAYVAELQGELGTIEDRGELSSEARHLVKKARTQLQAAREAINSRDTPMSLLSGSVMDRTWATRTLCATSWSRSSAPTGTM